MRLLWIGWIMFIFVLGSFVLVIMKVLLSFFVNIGFIYVKGVEWMLRL